MVACDTPKCFAAIVTLSYKSPFISTLILLCSPTLFATSGFFIGLFSDILLRWQSAFIGLFSDILLRLSSSHIEATPPVEYIALLQIAWPMLLQYIILCLSASNASSSVA